MSKVEREIVVDAPIEDVYRAWRDFESFPSFMSNIEHVREIGYGRSHWRSKGPLGQHAEWDAQMIVDEPARAIAWRSLEGGMRTQGAVRFEDTRGGATRLLVTLSYDAPAGALGELAAKIFANPDRQIEEDLRRFKAMLERTTAYRTSTGHRDEPAGRPASGEDDYAVQGKYPTNTGCAEPPYGPGMSNDESVRGAPHTSTTEATSVAPHPTTTGTPGGTLGAPTESDLKRDQQSISERTDTRM
jgi:uncharacterized protein YndB with AHSA1/START domain